MHSLLILSLWNLCVFYIRVHAWSLFSHVQLFVTLWIVAPPVSVQGNLLVRILEWVAMPSSRGSSRPRSWTCISCIGSWILYPLSHLGSRLHTHQFSSDQLLSRVRLFETPWMQHASVSITNSRSLLKLMSIESVMPFNHLVLCHPLLLRPSVFPGIRVFSNESALCITWPKYWSFSFSISPSNEYSGLIFFRIDWLDLLAVQGALKRLLQRHSSKAWCLWIWISNFKHSVATWHQRLLKCTAWLCVLICVVIIQVCSDVKTHGAKHLRLWPYYVCELYLVLGKKNIPRFLAWSWVDKGWGNFLGVKETKGEQMGEQDRGK